MADGIHQRFKDAKMVGFFTFGKPTLLIRDLDLAKTMLIKDFDYFVDRRKMALNESEVNKYFNNMLGVL